MAVSIKNSITVPAVDALVADKLSVDSLTVSRIGETFTATAHISFFAEDAQGNKKYAKNEDGTLIMDAVSSNDLFTSAGTMPQIGVALMAIQEAVAAMYDAKIDAQNAPVQEVPPEVPPTPPVPPEPTK